MREARKQKSTGMAGMERREEQRRVWIEEERSGKERRRGEEGGRGEKRRTFDNTSPSLPAFRPYFPAAASEQHVQNAAHAHIHPRPAHFPPA